MEKKPGRLKDVAKAAGVSLMTVSMALRNHPRISAATRKRISKLAERLNYRPDPDAQQLMEKVRAHKQGTYVRTIAALDFNHLMVGRDYYTEEVLTGAMTRADQLGYKLERFPVLGRSMSLGRLMVVLRTRNITGLIIPPLATGRGHLRLDWSQFAAVSTTGALWRPRLSSATPDFFTNACLAFREMRRRGHRRIGLMLPRHSEERSRHAFSAAYHWHCATEGIKSPLPVLLNPTKANILKWIKNGKFDAVVGNDYMEYDQLRSLDIIPKLAYGCLAWRSTRPEVAGVDLQPSKIGMAAVDVVDASLRRNELGLPVNPKTIIVEGRWVPAA